MIMHFKSKTTDENIEIYFDNIRITEATSTKFLGIFIDNKLKWNVHTDHVKKKTK